LLSSSSVHGLSSGIINPTTAMAMRYIKIGVKESVFDKHVHNK
jgi:hypothetical protein